MKDPTAVELLLELSHAHEVRHIATDSEQDKGAAKAYKRAAQILTDEESIDTTVRQEYAEQLDTTIGNNTE